MKFDYESDITGADGLALIDKYYIKDFTDEVLYSFDILLDVKGNTELMYDFPDEEWEVVREREIALIKKFCNSGKMVVFLSIKDEENCEIEFVDKEINTSNLLDVPSGKLVLVNAGELLQCAFEPELKMEAILEFDVEKGMYSIENEGIKKIVCSKTETRRDEINNIIEC